jgi:hypothetical protein
VRSAPILLTRTDGHFYEVFIADDVRDYDDASFATARAFRRDIAETDSVLIYEDSTVTREAAMWQRAHPQATQLDPDDIESDDPPPTLVTDDIEVSDVLGQWLTYGYSLNVDVAGRKSHVHRRRRGVLDIRSGARASLTTLFGATEAARLTNAGRTAFAQLQDSVRNSTDARSEMARKTLGSFAFDPMSFGLTDMSGAPAISYEIAGTAENGEALSIFLPTMTALAPDWWKAVSPTLPRWTSDSNTLVWKRANYDVVARQAINAPVLFISLANQPATGKSRSWPIAAVPEPAYQLIPLDAPAIDSATRNALAIAFDRSIALDGAARQAGFDNWRRMRIGEARMQLTVSSKTSAQPHARLRVSRFSQCPTIPLHQPRTCTQRSVYRISDATSSASSPSHSGSSYRAP